MELTGSSPDPYPEIIVNQPPGLPVPVLGAEGKWNLLQWGIELRIGSEQKKLVSNCRSETAAEKALFREGFASSRCVLPATGFFEWKRATGQSQPFFFRPREGAGLLLAGVILRARDQSSRVVILTKSADPWMGEIHHRAPVLIRPDRLSPWLDPSTTGEQGIRQSAFVTEEEILKRHPVSNRMNRVSENDVGILEPTEEIVEPIQGELF